MKEIISNLFKPTQPEQRIVTITAVLTPGVYHATDQSGRIYRAESELFWRQGDAVILQAGRIVARATRTKTPKIYEV